MKKLLFIAVAAAALSGAPAIAAELPLKAAPLLFDWTGWYGGVNTGYSWGRVRQRVSNDSATNIPYDSTTRVRGWEASGEGGYCWQRNGITAVPVVTCIEVRYDFPHERGHNDTPDPETPTRVTNEIATFLIGPKLGFLTDGNRTFWYAAGGVAIDDAKNSAFVPGDTAAGSKTKWRTGFFGGVGVEKMIDQHWSWKLEYDLEYFGKGSGFNNTLSPCTNTQFRCGTVGATPVVSVGKAFDNIVSVGLNYHFGSR
jgi:outer membrane immunogenic protein